MKHRYWQAYVFLFTTLGRGESAYGRNVYAEDWYPWDEYLHDALTLAYDFAE